MGNDMKKKDNRGMSLVELIIVIAIMGVMIGMTGYGLALVSKKPVDECAKKIEMVLNQNRTNAMGNTKAYVEFYLTDGKVTVAEHLENSARATDDSDTSNIIRKDTPPTVIGAEGVSILFYYEGDTTGHGLPTDTSNALKIGFSRDSGSVKGIDGGEKCIKIEVYKGTYVRTIKLDALTGKVTLN